VVRLVCLQGDRGPTPYKPLPTPLRIVFPRIHLERMSLPFSSLAFVNKFVVCSL